MTSKPAVFFVITVFTTDRTKTEHRFPLDGPDGIELSELFDKHVLSLNEALSGKESVYSLANPIVYYSSQQIVRIALSIQDAEPPSTDAVERLHSMLSTSS